MLSSNGVYICEDVHGYHHKFSAYIAGMINELNYANLVDSGNSKCGSFQADIHSVHAYPFMIVIEKNLNQRELLISDKKGTMWKPESWLRN